MCGIVETFPVAPNMSASVAKKATIKDVADVAGVGIGTVSRVLNESGPVSVETRERVMQAAQLLTFQVSDLGRALQRKSSKTFGCLVPSVVNPVFADALQAAQRVAEGAGYHFLLLCTDYDPAKEEDTVRTLLEKNVEGVVLTVSDAQNSRALQLLAERQVPHCLMFNGPANGSPASFVDNVDASSKVASAFAALGHKHTAFLALRFSASDRSQQRFAGFKSTCTAAGMPAPLAFEIDETTPAFVGEIEALLRANPQLTAIHASNDLLALSVMKAARNQGIAVPEELSIVGFDGIAVGELVDPPLATVVTDPRAMGREAMRAVVDAIETSAKVASAPEPLAFEIRSGGTLGPVRGDGDDAATSPPSHCHPEKTATSNQEYQR